MESEEAFMQSNPASLDQPLEAQSHGGFGGGGGVTSQPVRQKASAFLHLNDLLLHAFVLKILPSFLIFLAFFRFLFVRIVLTQPIFVPLKDRFWHRGVD